MSAFICKSCGHYGNTAVSHHLTDGLLCHICLQDAGKLDAMDKQLWGKYLNAGRFPTPRELKSNPLAWQEYLDNATESITQDYG